MILDVLSILSVLSVLWSGTNVLCSTDMFVSVQICSVVARNDKKPLFHTQNTNSIIILDVLSVLSVLSALSVLSVLLMLPDMFCGLLICFVVPEMTRNLYTQNTHFIMFLDVLSVLSVLSIPSVLVVLPDMFCGLLLCSVVPEMTVNHFLIPKIHISS
jgi:hypothetical protein